MADNVVASLKGAQQHVIASLKGAKQHVIASRRRSNHRLLRRFAPRNDTLGADRHASLASSAKQGEAQLREQIRRWRMLRQQSPKLGGQSLAPGCVFGLATRDALDNLAGDVDDIKAEIAWIRRVIITTIVSAGIGTLLKLTGWL